MKEWLKVGDKNKLGEWRKLIIHNSHFTWMNTTETVKLRLLRFKKKDVFWLKKFPLHDHSCPIYLAASGIRAATRNFFF